jgi:hypothetical protein
VGGTLGAVRRRTYVGSSPKPEPPPAETVGVVSPGVRDRRRRERPAPDWNQRLRTSLELRRGLPGRGPTFWG